MIKIIDTHSNPHEIPKSSKEPSILAIQPELKNSPSVLLTVNDVSRILNIHVNTVRRWSNQGVFKAIRLGPRGDRRYKLEDITNFLLSEGSMTGPPNK